jgi:MFS transporter, MCT family, solute carrier family 16 (monocarboxylic acid transporters), member 10
MLFAPCISFLAEWFVRRRGLANGIIFAGTALGGSFFPLVLPRLISTYGTSVTLRIIAVGFLIIVAPLIPFMRGRLPGARLAHGPTARGAHKALWNFPFVLSMILNMLQAFGFFVPVVWLPSECQVGLTEFGA